MKIKTTVKPKQRVTVPSSVRTEILKSIRQPSYKAKIPAIYSQHQISKFYAQCYADEVAKTLNKKL